MHSGSVWTLHPGSYFMRGILKCYWQYGQAIERAQIMQRLVAYLIFGLFWRNAAKDSQSPGAQYPESHSRVEQLSTWPHSWRRSCEIT